MKRTDSGFHESFRSYAPTHNDAATVHRSNTAPIRRRKAATTPTGSISSKRPIVMETQRPGSESHSRPSNQRSTTSSSRNSADQSRGRRQHSSKPCSRGTSRTGVDPSRSSRHYRMQSSHTAPTATSRDLDDPVALHFRSCSLFQNPSYHAHATLPSPTFLQQDQFGRPSIASRFSVDDVELSEEHVMTEQSEEIMLSPQSMNTPMSWTSPTTRQKDYRRIDRANTGARGFFNRIVPRCVSGPPEKFHEKDQSDAGSVRRYRLDDLDDVECEKQKFRKEKRSSEPSKKKKWMCF